MKANRKVVFLAAFFVAVVVGGVLVPGSLSEPEPGPVVVTLERFWVDDTVTLRGEVVSLGDHDWVRPGFLLWEGDSCGVEENLVGEFDAVEGVLTGPGLFSAEVVGLSRDSVFCYRAVGVLAGGVDWTIRTSAADNAWLGVAYGNGLFVAVAISGSGNRVMTSPDGVNWTIRDSAADNNWLGVAYGNGLFVAVANTGTGNRVMTSPDGVNWTIRDSAADNSWRGVAYGNGLFVAVADTGTGNRVMTSPHPETDLSLGGSVVFMAPPSLEIVTFRERVNHGQGFLVEALVLDGQGNPLEGELVNLTSSPPEVDMQEVTGSDGIARFTVALMQNTTYQVTAEWNTTFMDSFTVTVDSKDEMIFEWPVVEFWIPILVFGGVTVWSFTRRATMMAVFGTLALLGALVGIGFSLLAGVLWLLAGFWLEYFIGWRKAGNSDRMG
jgi:hypothetical protein